MYQFKTQCQETNINTKAHKQKVYVLFICAFYGKEKNKKTCYNKIKKKGAFQ